MQYPRITLRPPPRSHAITAKYPVLSLDLQPCTAPPQKAKLTRQLLMLLKHTVMPS